MNFPPGTTLATKRAQCRPEVYRYRYPSANIALGHTLRDHIYACHEIEIYPADLLTCASGNASILFNMKGAFDNNGTPNNFTDDKPRGTPLPCKVRPSSSERAVPDRRDGRPTASTASATAQPVGARRAGLDRGRLALARRACSTSAASSTRAAAPAARRRPPTRRGRTSTSPTSPSSRTRASYLIVYRRARRRRAAARRDLRAGRRQPRGQRRRCTAYRVDRLQQDRPRPPPQEAYERLRAPPDRQEGDLPRRRSAPARRRSFCTAHVFQQIPGQNRIFMGWYSQGTQVVDFVEQPERHGRARRRPAGSCPTNANTWVSAMFKYQAEPERHVHVLGSDRRLQPRESGAARSTSGRSRCRRRRSRG